MTVVTLSLEIELGWGVHDVEQFEKLSDDRRAETRSLKRLLAVCDETEIPFSFDVVGHLFESACRGNHDSPHPAEWWDADPGTDVRADPWFYAPDLLDLIEAAVVDHEVCTHSFSHVDCDRADSETISWDLGQGQRRHEKRFGRRTRSFVPPKHRVPPASALHENGIDVIRQLIESDRSKPGKLKELLAGPLPNRPPRFDDGIVVSYSTSYPSLTSPALPQGSRSRQSVFKALPLTNHQLQLLQRRKLIDAVERAISTGTPIHLWSHLYNLSNRWQLEVVRDLCHYLNAERRAGRIDVVPMRGLPTEFAALDRGEIRVEAES